LFSGPQLAQAAVFNAAMIAGRERERARRALATFLTACCVLLATGVNTATAAPADLDRSFGSDGIARVDGPGGPNFPADAFARMAVGPQDEVFVLYSSFASCDPPFDCVVDLAIARYDADGKRDASFGTGPGSVLQVRQFTERHAFDLAVGPDGKPVVVASDHSLRPEGSVTGATVARFDREGHLDGTFGVGGKAPQPFEAFVDDPLAVAVQSDGKIVVAGEGSMTEGGGQELLLARYLPNGELDPGFGSGGKAAATLPTRTRPADLLLDASGNITVPAPLCCVGSSGTFGGGGFAVARFLADGRADTGFAGTGQLVFPTPGAIGFVEAAAPAPDGGTYLSFEENTETVSTVGNMVKLLPSGLPDAGFGTGGRLRLFDRVGDVDPSALTVDGKGRIVGVGWGDGKVSAFRLRPEGSTDRTFNGGQHVDAPFGGVPLAFGLQSSGRIVVLGDSGCCGTKGFALIAFRGGTDHTRCLGHKATIVGTRRADELVGTPHRDVIAALGGKDKVRGLSGPDLICGGKGKDKLLGGPGRDQIRP
jgi:uncharacterized delta-60 repeat protein